MPERTRNLVVFKLRLNKTETNVPHQKVTTEK